MYNVLIRKHGQQHSRYDLSILTLALQKVTLELKVHELSQKLDSIEGTAEKATNEGDLEKNLRDIEVRKGA